MDYGVGTLGFPLVVKPRGGSVARHVTTNIETAKDLRHAIEKAITYSPAYIIERFVKNSFVYRATVVDFDSAFCVMQTPAMVMGDGTSTIQALVNKKNTDKKNGMRHGVSHEIVIDSTTEELLLEKKYDLSTVLKKSEVVYLQRNPFLKLGGDLVEVTENVHPDNMQLFKDIATFFDIRLVGMDFMIPDISVSWRTQHSAILELNSMPCIEMHQFPSSGRPQNVAGVVVDLFFKYYVNAYAR
jgi:cyanophycin synthetase